MSPKLPQLIDKTNIKQFLDKFDNVLTDCDGVIWSDDIKLGRSDEALNKLRKFGKKIFYVTNNSTKARDAVVQKCAKLGFEANKEEVITSSYITAQYLKQQHFDKKVYIMGASGIALELDEVGISHTQVGPEHLTTDPFKLNEVIKLEEGVGAVVIGFDGDISFPKIVRAASYLKDPTCLFIATNTDEVFPIKDSDLVIPGAGCMVRSVETVAARQPLIMGKPSEKMFTVIKEKHQLDPSRTLMIGDRCNTDILFGKHCGLVTLVVLTGVTSMADMESWATSNDPDKQELLADYCLPRLEDLLELMQEA